MSCKSIVIDGMEYLPVKDREGEAFSLILADNRGLTIVGWVDWSQDGERILVRDARCVIRWGTDKHLAQLCNGPRPNTVLGAKSNVYLRRQQVIADFPIDEKGWGNE